VHSLCTRIRKEVVKVPGEIDQLDARLLLTLRAHPRIGLLEVSRRLGVARGTVQARLDKLELSGAISSFAPTLEPQNFGYPVTAFVSLEVEQTDVGNPAAKALTAIPEVIEISSVSGSADLLVRVVARSNADLQRVIQRIIGAESVTRSSSSIVLRTFLERRTLAVFVEAAAVSAAQME
jgi:DNA-binding Lrp family transcriptional regulator